ncbi:MAG: DEAD/DEAH box helicase [Candidatus Babeliales bacterium]
MKTFQEMGLPETILDTLKQMNFDEPTPIQAEAIPLALQGRDILGSAQTGTGKTGAFSIPLVAHLIAHPRSTALVMTPTRELANQVMNQLQTIMGKKSSIKCALLIGGEPMPKQFAQLRNQPRCIVGTPGRINDHLKRGTLLLHNTTFLVLDETDRMLDMGFSVQIDAIMRYITAQHQTLLFSATLSKGSVRTAEKYLRNPARVAIGETSGLAPKIKQDVLRISESEKYPSLLSQLDQRLGSVIVFVKTKYSTEKIAGKLIKEGYNAKAIHGDLRQHKRDSVLRSFRDKICDVLVATDVAARGLDVSHVMLVINYDLPQSLDDYIHRIGRTARAGSEGSALNLITPADRNKWNMISNHLLNPDAKQSDMTQGNQFNKHNKRPFRNGGGGRKNRFASSFHKRSSNGFKRSGVKKDRGASRTSS